MVLNLRRVVLNVGSASDRLSRRGAEKSHGRPRPTGVARCDPHIAPELRLRLEPDASAAFKGLSQRPIRRDLRSGLSDLTDRVTVNAAMRAASRSCACRPAAT
jgi:hypothetical protein